MTDEELLVMQKALEAHRAEQQKLLDTGKE
jgi:hypothetical protein